MAEDFAEPPGGIAGEATADGASTGDATAEVWAAEESAEESAAEVTASEVATAEVAEGEYGAAEVAEDEYGAAEVAEDEYGAAEIIAGEVAAAEAAAEETAAAAEMAPADAHPAPVLIAGRYGVGEPIVETRLGWTYEAWDFETEQDVEVTYLYAEIVAAAADVEARLEEVRGLQHLHVLPLLHWELHPAPCLVYPAPTMRLRQLIAAGAALTPSQTLLIGLQAAETLHALRERGITHGDLTPSQCCIDITGRLRLAEMGVDFLRYPDDSDPPSRYRAPEAVPTISTEEVAIPGEVADVADVLEATAEAEVPSAPDGADTIGASSVRDDSSTAVAERGVADGDAVEGAVESAGDTGAGDAAGVAAEADEDVADTVEQAVPAETPSAGRRHDAGAADLYGLALVLAEAAAGRPLAPAKISSLGKTVLPSDAAVATARQLSRLAPLLEQAAAPNPEDRLSADELALALRATAEMLPPPSRLDEAFRSVKEDRLQPTPVTDPEPVGQREVRPPRNLLLRLVAAAAVVVAATLLVLSVAGDDDTPSHVVPDVAGMSWTQANSALIEAGWEVRRLEVRVPGVAVGEVIGQLPEPGGLLDEGQVVKVQVSLGEPLVVVPADIVGMPLAQAELRLSAIGLRLGSVSDRFDLSVPDGAVVAIAESLPELPRGSTVDLVIAVDR